MKFLKKLKQIFKRDDFSAFPFSSYHFDFELNKSIYVTRLMIPNNWANDEANAKQPYYGLLTPGGVNFNTSEVSLSIRMKICPDATGLSDHKAKLAESYTEGGWRVDESHSKLKTHDDRSASVFIGMDPDAGYIRYDVVLVLVENPQVLISFEFQINSLNPGIINNYLPLLDGLIQSIKVSKTEDDAKEKQGYMLAMINKLNALKK
jgi:hypothetical protein